MKDKYMTDESQITNSNSW